MILVLSGKVLVRGNFFVVLYLVVPLEIEIMNVEGRLN